ncbi:hypothetical protein FQZ97_677850 [compost metagenome]
MHARGLVDGRDRTAYRRPVFFAGDGHHAAECLQDDVVALPPVQRPFAAEAGNAAIHHVGPQRGRTVVIDAQAGRHAWAEALDHDVGCGDQPLRGVAALWRFQIQRDAALVAVHAQEHRAVLLPERRPAAGIVPLGRFYLDHLCAHVAQVLRAQGPGQHLGKIHHPQSLQGIHYIRLPRTRLAALKRRCSRRPWFESWPACLSPQYDLGRPNTFSAM